MKPETYQLAYDGARQALSKRSPRDVVARSETRFEELENGQGRFVIPYLGTTHFVSYPDGHVSSRDGDPVTIGERIILLHYLLTSDGSPLTGEWLNFRQLPGGLLYLSAFESQCTTPLSGEFGYNLARFVAAAEAIGGERTRIGDASFLFRALPRFPVICILWLGDDELPPAASFLFDASAAHYLPTEDVAVLCDEIRRRFMGTR